MAEELKPQKNEAITDLLEIPGIGKMENKNNNRIGLDRFIFLFDF